MVTLAIEHIIKDERGRPAIADTRLRVTDVAMWHKGGMTVEEMIKDFPITAGQAYAALSYYYDHRAEIEALINEMNRAAEEMLSNGEATTIEDLKARIQKDEGQ